MLSMFYNVKATIREEGKTENQTVLMYVNAKTEDEAKIMVSKWLEKQKNINICEYDNRYIEPICVINDYES
jgi:hypothetical protein